MVLHYHDGILCDIVFNLCFDKNDITLWRRLGHCGYISSHVWHLPLFQEIYKMCEEKASSDLSTFQEALNTLLGDEEEVTTITFQNT